jgi:hypothetical protein
MTTVTTTYGTVTTYAVAASLPSPNYDLTQTTYNSTVNKPADILFEYTATVAANSTGNKQIVLFVQGALDSISWGAPPSGVTDTTHDSSMRLLGTIPTNGGASAEVVRGQFSIATSFGGVLPPFWRVIAKNDCGVALSSCSARTQELGISAA